MKWQSHGFLGPLVRLICLVVAAPTWLVMALIVDDSGRFSDAQYVLVYELGLAPGASVALQLSNTEPVNNTYVMVLTHSQLYAWQRHLVALPSRNGQDIPSSYFGTLSRKEF